MLNTENLDREDVCAVCGSRLETAFYMDIDSFDGKADWLCGIKINVNDENKKLKRCKRCGLLYAK